MTKKELQDKWYDLYCAENVAKWEKNKKMSKYTREEIDEMKELLSESEWEGLKDRELREILWDGCIGWANVEDADVIEMYEENYGFAPDNGFNK